MLGNSIIVCSHSRFSLSLRSSLKNQNAFRSISSHTFIPSTSTRLSSFSNSPSRPTFNSPHHFSTLSSSMAQTKGSAEPESASTLVQPEGPEEWKHREPYRIHESGENFKALYEAHCHCGKVQYQLSREKPLASKFCHCTTCQRLHGMSFTLLGRQNSEPEP